MGLLGNNVENIDICNTNRLFVVRNGKPYGPYSLEDLRSLTSLGKTLACDKVTNTDVIDDNTRYETIRSVLKFNNIQYKVEAEGSILSQVSRLGKDLLFPKELLDKETWSKDKRLLLLTIIGMFPLIGVTYIPSDFLRFYAISLYFSSMWAMFFYSFYKTKQVKTSTTLKIFFLTQLVIIVAWDLLGLPNLNIFYLLTNSNGLLSNIIGFVFGVGFTEELGKMLVLFFLLKTAKEPMTPQTMVFYGLISGLAFGVFEGVQYQLTVNAQQGYADAYYLNIARMTTLPFIHAIWTALAGFFLSFAHLYPRYRKGLYFLAISIPALGHGLYDSFCSVFPLIAFGISIISVGLLNVYLGDSKKYQSRLKL
ncbi:MAG: PrsW family intramembrane metalloprotease [Paludibacteraceae bacterium]|nr:PrsW family intramembrane metalloprotease [Paludibacteraceae bacterium]